MKSTTHFLALLLLGTVAACATAPAPAPASSEPKAVAAAAAEPGALDQGRALTTQFYKGELAPIWAKMSKEMRSALGGEDNLRTFREQLAAQLGAETKILDEKAIAHGSVQICLRTASFSKVAVPVVVQWALASNGEIAGFFVRPSE